MINQHNDIKEMLYNSKRSRIHRTKRFFLIAGILLALALIFNAYLANNAQAFKAKAMAQLQAQMQAQNIATEKATAYLEGVKQLTANYNNN